MQSERYSQLLSSSLPAQHQTLQKTYHLAGKLSEPSAVIQAKFFSFLFTDAPYSKNSLMSS